MPDIENTAGGDRERRALPPDLQPLHDWLLDDGAARREQLPGSDRLIMHAARLVAQGRDNQQESHVSPAHRRRGNNMTAETTIPDRQQPVQIHESRSRPRRRAISLIAAITLATVVVVALAGALYLRQRLQQGAKPTPPFVYVLSRQSPIDNGGSFHGAATITAVDATGKAAWGYQLAANTLPDAVKIVAADNTVL
ncbi:MAG TPA: hypothetical protein VKB76_02890, partial [Ktedonobacterales bacterium]|nr:hypothetical protein [Ktedonobacterales bacterium]